MVEEQQTAKIDFSKAERLITEAHGLWRAQVLSSAAEIALFDTLEQYGNRPKTLEEVCDGAKIKCLRPQDFLDALVSMGHISKSKDGKYFNNPDGSTFLVSSSPHYIGILLIFRGKIKDCDYGNLTTYLKGGEVKGFAQNFAALYQDVPGSNKSFADYMRTCIILVAPLLAQNIAPFWKSIKSFADIGGGSGFMTMKICEHHPHLKGVNTDLHQLKEVYDDYLSKESKSVQERVSFKELDFFKDDFPRDLDAIMFGNVIHDWDDNVKKMLIKKAFDALASGSHIVIYDFFLDEERREKTDNFLMSLAMQLLATGSQFTHSELKAWLTEAGFVNYRSTVLDKYQEVVIATKP